jgi:hypothetical protein
VGHRAVRLTEPPADVERLEADAALAKHGPSVVVGAWITQRRHNKRRPAREVLDAPALASTLVPYGVEEVRILQIANYITSATVEYIRANASTA